MWDKSWSFDCQAEVEKSRDWKRLEADEEAGSSSRWQREEEDNVLAYKYK